MKVPVRKPGIFKNPVRTKNNNIKIGFTNGCFDILHYGHCRLLVKAKSFGDILILALNSDYSIKRLKDLEAILEEQSFTYTKKETLQFEKSVEKLNKALGGIKDMNGKPDLLFIIDTNREVLAVKEAVKMGIPIIGVLDSNSDPDGIDYPIPGNDDAMRSIEYYCTIIADTIIESRKNIKSNLNEKK